MMLKVGFNKHYLVIPLVLVVLYAKAQTPPSFTSTPVETGTYGVGYTYSITTTDVENNNRSITISGTLPAGITFSDLTDGTAQITGTANEVGDFPITLTVNDLVDATQNTQAFTISIAKAAAGIVLSDLNHTYTGLSQSATAVTTPAGLTVNITYEGSSTPPSDVGSYAVIATINDVNYAGTANGTLIIDKATPVVTWTTPSAITYGTALNATQLNATSSIPGTFTYTPATGTILNAGASQTLSVDFTPADAANYNTVTGTQVSITVNKVTPTVTWTSPSTIIYGTALSVTQLNATASVPGSFTYTPAAGTVLDAGANQTLSVNFIPTDATNYNAVNGTQRQITVNKATPTVTWVAPAAITYGTALSATQLNATASAAGTFTYTPATGTVLNAGVGQTLSVDFTPTDASNYNSVTGTQKLITVNKATPTVTWANPAAITYGTPLSATQLNATASVAGTFTYTPVAGTVLNAGAGQILSVDFTPTNASNYNTVAGTQKLITVNKATPVITWAAPAAITYGTALSATQLNATASVAGTFTYTPAAGTVLNAGVGQTLSVDFAPTDAINYNAVAGTQKSITVNKAIPTVTWANPATITYGTALSATQLNATASVAGTFTYTPAAGTVLNAGAGQTLSVDFAPTDASNYNAVAGTQKSITVNKALPVITWAAPSAITYGTALSATQLNATASVAGTFTYTPAAGTVPNAGSQPLTVNFSPTDATNYATVTGTQVSITVNKATPSVTWSNPTAITYGTPLSATQLNATASVAGSFSYAPGTGTILSAGSNVLSVNFTPTDASNYNSVNGTQVSIVVNKATPIITWATPAAITYGTALSATQLNATANVIGTFTYTPASGTVLNAGAGQTLSVNFFPSDATNYNTVNNTQVLITVNKATPTITWANPAAITYKTLLSATHLNASSVVAGTFIYTPASGTQLNAGVSQTLSVDFTPADANNYNTVSGIQRQITVNKATPAVTWSAPAAITYGASLSATQLNATASEPGTFSYSPGINTTLNAGANQTLSVNFTPTDAANYNSVPGTQRQITVNKATPVITWSDPLPIRINVPLSSTQLNATANVAGVFSYTPPAGTILSAGINQLLSVNFTPSDASNYNSVTNTQVHITVSNKDNPVVTWANPSAITYGTLLSATQLNATASVPGTYTYTPAVGTLLNAGINQNLKIDFAPTDNVNYNDISKTVQITVNRAVLTATASSANRTYGTANPAFTIAYSGFVNGETVAVIDTPPAATCLAIANDNAGSTFPVIPSGGSDNNYSFSYVNGTLTITKAPLTATADNKSKLYGSVNPVLTISYTGFVNGNNSSVLDTPPNPATSATPSSSTGLYPISISGGTDNNYDFNYAPGTLTITPVTLTAKADNINQAYGITPSPTVSYSGFVNGDNAGVLDTAPVASTLATASSSPGTYLISISGGADNNYSFAYTTGTLAINKAMLTVTANSLSRLFNTNNPPLTINYSGFANNETASVINVAPVASTAATPASPGGVYPIIVSGGVDDNYDFTYITGTLTVVVNNPPVLASFQVNTDEDINLALTYSMFNQHITDDPGSQIAFIKILSIPANGALSWKGNKVLPGDEITTNGNSIDNFSYTPNKDFNGFDSFTWNVSDGTFLSGTQATLTLKINAVNDAPVLSNIESAPIQYSLGDLVPVTQKLTVNDIDNNFIHSAKITIAENYSSGDNLSLGSAANSKIVAAFNSTKGELTLTGKDSKSNYETALSQVLFNIPVSGNVTLSSKTLTIVVNDSTANSNAVSRIVEITEVFPELDLVNSFTPNNDGVNDQWDIGNLNLYSKIKLFIFNAEGIKVFTCTDQTCQWDGKLKGQDLPAGPYLYTIDLNDGKRKYQGTVTILK